MYCRDDERIDPWLLLGAWRRALGEVTFGGRTAAWIHGLDVVPDAPVQVVVPLASSARSCNGVQVRHCDLDVRETIFRRRLKATSIHRTLRDMSGQSSKVEALVAIDMALHKRAVDLVELGRYVVDCSGLPGSARLRELIQVAAPAESPMETRLRWLLVTSGLPSPQVQTDLFDSYGAFLGRADIYYPSARLVVEFDGGIHRDQLVKDDRRQNGLVNSGFTVLRFTSADLASRSAAVVAEVRSALAASVHAHFARNARNPRELNARFGGKERKSGYFGAPTGA
jgi:hypothetical protein